MKIKQMRVVTLSFLLLVGFFFSSVRAGAAELYVCISTGNNQNPGTLALPFKNIDAALKKAATGDTIKVAEGIYSGTFEIGFLEIDKAVILMGGFAKGFGQREVTKFPTVFQPNNASGAKSRKALINLVKNNDGFVLDGFVLDMGQRNSYSTTEGKPQGLETGILLLPPSKQGRDNTTVTEPLLRIGNGNQGGIIKIQNNVFVNGAQFAIQGGIALGKLEIRNNVFVSNRMAAIEVWGTHGRDLAEAEIVGNSIVFSWSRLKDFGDMGYGVRIMTKMKYTIEKNLIGGAILAGVDNTRFAKDENIFLKDNVFFLNTQGDLEYSPQSNTKLNLSATQFGDLPFASARGNVNPPRLDLALDKKYREGFEKALETPGSMFANRYPWKSALDLFGSSATHGAQKNW